MKIREAHEDDAPGIRDVFHASYGDSYTYPEFFESGFLRRIILGEDTVMLVAEQAGEIIGTASVILEVGAMTDLAGEFGRLAVHPDHRGRGVGGKLMDERIERVRDRLHVALVDCRVLHPYSLQIAEGHGFGPVGLCPLKDQFDRRESGALLLRFFGDAVELRRNHPRIIPEVQPLANAAMRNVNLPVDVIVDDSAAPYPHDDAYELEELTTDGYTALLRIERGRVRHREIFGPMRLHYGFFKLRAKQATYLIARRASRLAGAVGFMRNKFEHTARIFELIAPDDGAIRFLLAEVERRAREDWNTAYLELDVSADAPRMQRTLLELGFLPAAYLPLMAFHDVERLDLVRMVRLLVPLDGGETMTLTPGMREIADLVLEPIRRQQLAPTLAPALERAGLLEGLTAEQLACVAAVCETQRFDVDENIIREGDASDALFVIIDGHAEIEMEHARGPVGIVAAGEALGEMGLLLGKPHAAGAVAKTPVHAARISDDALRDLFRRRPDVGIVVFRNIATGLGRKLARTDLTAFVGNE